MSDLQSPPYGRDTSATDYVRPGRIVSGGVLLGEAAYRRLISERDSLEDDPEYGFAIITRLNMAFTPEDLAALPGEVRNELTKDERLDSVEVVPTRIVMPSGGIELELEIDGVGKDGSEFNLVMRANAVTTELLHLWGT